MSEQGRIEQDLERTRSRLNARLNALQDRLSPNQIVQDLMSYAQGSDAGEFASNLMAGAKRNPLPATLTGIGLAWLMAANARDRNGSVTYQPAQTSLRWDSDAHLDAHIGRAESAVVRQDGEDEPTFGERVIAARGQALGVVRSAQDTGANYATRISDAVASARQSITAGAHDVRDRVSDLTQSVGDSAERVGGQLAGQGRSVGRLGGDAVSGIMESPVILGAIGLGIGALLGALVPQTAAEEDALGTMAEDARQALKKATQEVVDRGGAAAQQAIAAGRDSAKAHGITGQQELGDVAHTAASGQLSSSVADVAKNVLKAADETLRKPAPDKDAVVAP